MAGVFGWVFNFFEATMREPRDFLFLERSTASNFLVSMDWDPKTNCGKVLVFLSGSSSNRFFPRKQFPRVMARLFLHPLVTVRFFHSRAASVKRTIFFRWQDLSKTSRFTPTCSLNSSMTSSGISSYIIGKEIMSRSCLEMDKSKTLGTVCFEFWCSATNASRC